MPLLNGRQYDWVSVQIVLPSLGSFPVTVQSVTYPSHTMDAQDVYGTGTGPIGYTRGQYTIDNLEMEFLASEWDAIRTSLGAGYMKNTRIPIAIVYVDRDLVPRKDEFSDCKITGEQQSISMGTDPLKTKVTFKPSQMVLNGVPAIIAQRI